MAYPQEIGAETMFPFLARGKAAGIAAGLEADAAALSATARQKRVFDRTVMSPDIVLPEAVVPRGRDQFGSKCPIA